jgi:hypothetical protein
MVPLSIYVLAFVLGDRKPKPAEFVQLVLSGGMESIPAKPSSLK